MEVLAVGLVDADFVHKVLQGLHLLGGLHLACIGDRNRIARLK